MFISIFNLEDKVVSKGKGVNMGKSCQTIASFFFLNRFCLAFNHSCIKGLISSFVGIMNKNIKVPSSFLCVVISFFSFSLFIILLGQSLVSYSFFFRLAFLCSLILLCVSKNDQTPSQLKVERVKDTNPLNKIRKDTTIILFEKTTLTI